MDELTLEAGDFICFDKAYIDYKRFYLWTQQGISMVTRMKTNAIYKSIEELDIPDKADDRIIKDEVISVSTKDADEQEVQLKLRRVLKQNFPLKYFLGDNQNAIEIQIWTSHILMLLIEVLKNKITRKWAFSNLVSMLRTHIMSYINAITFLNNPEQAWSENKNEKIKIEQLELKFSSA